MNDNAPATLIDEFDKVLIARDLAWSADERLVSDLQPTRKMIDYASRLWKQADAAVTAFRERLRALESINAPT